MDDVVFPDEAVTYKEFFESNNKVLEMYFGISYFKVNDEDELLQVFKDKDNNQIRVTLKNGDPVNDQKTVTVTKLEVLNIFNEKHTNKTYSKTTVTSGGRKVSIKKEICGKLRCIYKIPGSRKEHIKYKGRLIAVADYKKLMKKA